MESLYIMNSMAIFLCTLEKGVSDRNSPPGVAPGAESVTYIRWFRFDRCTAQLVALRYGARQ